MQKSKIIVGALILTAANIITRLLGFFYRIYMTKLIGAEGMGLYQCIMPLYLLIWAISSSGLTTSVSKLTAQEKAKGKSANAHLILMCACVISLCIAVPLSLALHKFAMPISVKIFSDIRTAPSLRLLSYCFPCMAVGSVIRGYFYGTQSTKVPAASQVLEQCVRIATVFVLSDTLMQKGIEFACAGAVIGMVAGEILAFVLTGICYIIHLDKVKIKGEPQISVLKAVGILCAMAVPLTLNRVFSSLLSTAENILIPQRLQLFGLTRSESLEVYGKLFGMAMPLVMFPSSLLTALSTTMLPAISEGHTLKQKTALTSAIRRCVMLTSVIGMGTAAVFAAYPNEIGQIIYKTNISSMLRFVGVLCPFLYIQVMFSGILNGFGEQLFIFKIGLLSGIINLIFIYFMTPVIGIAAFFTGWTISTVVTTLLSTLRIQRYTSKSLKFLNICAKPFLAAVLAAFASLLLRNKLYEFVSFNLCTILSIAAMGLIYIALLYLTDYNT